MSSQVKAKKAAQAIKGGQSPKVTKIRTANKFRRPLVKQQPRRPAYEHRAVRPVSLKRNECKIIRAPVSSDKASTKIETENTLTFIVDITATKKEIADAVRVLYNVKAEKISTLITPKLLKKAYVRLTADQDASIVAQDIGMV